MALEGPLGAVQEYQLGQAQMAEYQALAQLRQQQAQKAALDIKATEMAMADDAKARQIQQSVFGNIGLNATPDTGAPTSTAPAAGAAPDSSAGVTPGAPAAAAPASAGVISSPVQMFNRLQAGIDRQSKLADAYYSKGLIGRGDEITKGLTQNLQHLMSGINSYENAQGQAIKNADESLKFVQGVAVVAKDKPSFQRAQATLLASKPLESMTPMEREFVSLDYDKGGKQLVDDWTKRSKIGLENQRLAAQSSQALASAYASNMRAKLDGVKLDREVQVKKDYDATVDRLRKSGTPDTEIPTQTEWTEGLKHPGSKGSAQERMRGEAILGATSELGRSLQIISKLPVTSSGGIFGSMKAKSGFFDAPLNVAANLGTAENERMYNIAASNIGQAIAILDNNGYKPNQAQINNFSEKFRWQPTDTVPVKLYSMADAVAQAEARAKITLANPYMPKEQKRIVQDLLEAVQKEIFFTPEDVIEARDNRQSIQDYINKERKKYGQDVIDAARREGKSIKEYTKSKKAKEEAAPVEQPAPGGMPAGWSVKVQ